MFSEGEEDSWLEIGNKVTVFISGDHRRMENWLFHLCSPVCCSESLLSPSGQPGHVGDPEMLRGR